MYRNNHYIQQAYQKLWKLGKQDKRIIAINFKDLFENNKLMKLKNLKSKINNQILTKESEKIQLIRNTQKLFSTTEFIDDDWDNKNSVVEEKGFKSLESLVNELNSNKITVQKKSFSDIELILRYFLLNYVRSKYFLKYLNNNIKNREQFNFLRDDFQRKETEYLKDFVFFIYSNNYLNTYKKDGTFLFSELNMIYKDLNKVISNILIKKYISLDENLLLKYDEITQENYYNFFMKNFILIILSPNHVIYGVKKNIFIPDDIYNICANNIINSMLLFDFYLYNFMCIGNTFVLKRKRIDEFYKHLDNLFSKDTINAINQHNEIQKIFEEKINTYKSLPNK